MNRPLATGLVLGALLTFAPATPAKDPPPDLKELAARVAALEAAVADLQAAYLPQELTVNCSAGETVTAALNKVGFRPGVVTITVAGTCTEAILVSRDRTTIKGATANDGLRALPDQFQAISIRGRSFSLQNLKVQGGVAASNGADVGLLGVTITDCAETSGLSVSGNSTGRLIGSTVTGCRVGVSVNQGGNVRIAESVIDGNGTGFMGVQVSGGQATLLPNTIVRNIGNLGIGGFGLWVQGGFIIANADADTFVRIEGNYHGVGVNAGGAFSASGSGVVISGNVSVGVAVMMGGSASMNGIRVADTSAGPGMFIRGGGHITLGEGTIVENNAKGGVGIQNLGVGDFQGAIIRNNRFNGINVSTIGLALFYTSGPPTQVLNNDYWGIFCADPPDIGLITGAGSGMLQLSGNGFSGQTNCTCVGAGC